MSVLKQKYFGDHAFRRMVLRIAVPVMVQNGITNFVSLLDNIMVGQVGTEPMSGVAIVNQLLFVYSLCIFGGLAGAGIFTAQFYGQGDQEGIRQTFRYKLWTGILLTGAAFGQEILDPVDNLRSEYRNEVHAYTNVLDEIGAALGPGSGREAKTLTATAIATHQSTVGVPISVQPANIMLGEKLEPPEGWNGAAPTIHNSGGMLVWIDYAKTVLAIEAGTVSIDWPLTSGGTESRAGVVSASPTKRPVRLYWTHERPKTVNDTYRTLQNSGPTVTFGSRRVVPSVPASVTRIPSDLRMYTLLPGFTLPLNCRITDPRTMTSTGSSAA